MPQILQLNKFQGAQQQPTQHSLFLKVQKEVAQKILKQINMV
jgi:hypothetical protein